MVKRNEKKEEKEVLTTEGKWYRIKRDDDFTFSLLERDGDEVKRIHSDIVGIVLPMADEALQRECGVL